MLETVFFLPVPPDFFLFEFVFEFFLLFGFPFAAEDDEEVGGGQRGNS